MKNVNVQQKLWV